MPKKTNVAYVSYDMAQKLLPIFRYYSKDGPLREIRSDASAIVRLLEDVDNKSYNPLPGMQIFMSDTQYEFFNDVLAQAES